MPSIFVIAAIVWFLVIAYMVAALVWAYFHDDELRLRDDDAPVIDSLLTGWRKR